MISDDTLGTNTTGYKYGDAELNSSHGYLLTKVIADLRRFENDGKRLFDLGCSNGNTAALMARKGWSVTGVDVSEGGIRQAQRRYPDLQLEYGSTHDDLAAKHGTFPIVLSLKVLERVYKPRGYSRTLLSLVEPGAQAILSTPYYCYLKNLALAITGKMDAHFTALWDHGQIKSWSIDTLGQLLREVRFTEHRFKLVGRVPPLAKSMIAIAAKPR